MLDISRESALKEATNEFFKDYIENCAQKNFNSIDEVYMKVFFKTHINNGSMLTEMLARKELHHAIKELYFWQYGDGTNFNSLLYNLFRKADIGNFSKLSKGFPEFAVAYLLWYNSNDSEQFFKHYDFLHV
jgi:hypothetical protein